MSTAQYRIDKKDFGGVERWAFIVMEDGKSDVVYDSLVSSSSAVTWLVSGSVNIKDQFKIITTFQGTTILASYKAKAMFALPYRAEYAGPFTIIPETFNPDARFDLVVPLSNPNDIQVGGDHYKGANFQPWDWELKGLSGWMQAAVKYVTRYDKKDGVKDLNKALHYIDKTLYHFKRGEHVNRCGFNPGDLHRFFTENNITDQDAQWAIQYCVGWSTEQNLLSAKKHINVLIKELTVF